jgi:protein-tyrosine-phosphatase
MAEAIARYDAADVIDSSSSGLSPLGFIPDLTKRTLAINGYSADGLNSDKTTKEACDGVDIIINMTGKPWDETFSNHEKVEDWIVQDPYKMDPETYQRVFEGVQRRIGQLAKGLRNKRENRGTGK